MHSVGIWFRGRVVSGRPRAADDLDEVAYFALDVVPENLAFATDRLVIEQLRGELRPGVATGSTTP